MNARFLTSTATVLTAALLLAACDDDRDARPTAAQPRSTPQPSAPAASASAPPARPAPQRPYNVVLLMIDSMRSDMPWNGYERDIAPNLEKLAKRSVTYVNGYSMSSYTAKSVVPALVGDYPSALPRDGYFFTKWPDENLLISERLQKRGHRTIAGHAHGYFKPSFGMGNDQGFDDYQLIPGTLDLKAVTSVTSEAITTLAKKQLSAISQSAGEQKRFFAYYHYLDPHHTYEFHREHSKWGRKARDLYDGELHFTDHHVGELLDFIAKQPWAERTVIIVTADHGEGFGERNHFRHAYELWESLVRVPIIVHVPGVEPRKLDVRRGHVDLAPTIADLMGIEKPDPPFRGQSLVPEVFGEVKPEPRPVIVDLPRSDLMDRRRAVISGGWKLVAFGDDRVFKLFHLDRDPWEETDLAEKNPEKLAEMKKLYFAESEKIPKTPVTGGAPLEGAPRGQRW